MHSRLYMTVADPGGRGGHALPHPVRTSHEKDGHQKWLHRFHVSRPPPPRLWIRYCMMTFHESYNVWQWQIEIFQRPHERPTVMIFINDSRRGNHLEYNTHIHYLRPIQLFYFRCPLLHKSLSRYNAWNTCKYFSWRLSSGKI